MHGTLTVGSTDADDVASVWMSDAFVASAGIRLCGPFELLSAADAGKEEVATEKPLFLHGRFSTDPPEVLTTLVGVSSTAGQHWGYFRSVLPIIAMGLVFQW